MTSHVESMSNSDTGVLPSGAGAEWARNWKIPTVSAIAIGVSMSPLYSLGALMPAIHASTGWSRSQISSGTLLLSAAALLLSPVVGTAVDRFGSRRVALPGFFLFAFAEAGLSLAHGRIATWWLCWAVLGVCAVFVTMTVWFSAVVKHFTRARGLALGLTLSGTGLGSATLPYIATVLQERVGWQRTYDYLALGGLLLVIPLLFFFFRDGAGADQRRAGDSAKARVPGNARSSFLSRQYIQLVLVCVFSVPVGAALAVHFVPILRSFGYAPRVAAATAGAAGLAAILGRLVAGFLIDRLSGPLVGALSCGTAVLVAPVLLLSHRPAAGLTAAILLGLSVGSEMGVFSYLVSRYFDIRQYGLFFGTLNGVITFATGLGPLFGGLMFDKLGNYTGLLWISVPLFAVSTVLLATLGKPLVLKTAIVTSPGADRIADLTASEAL